MVFFIVELCIENVRFEICECGSGIILCWKCCMEFVIVIFCCNDV